MVLNIDMVLTTWKTMQIPNAIALKPKFNRPHYNGTHKNRYAYKSRPNQHGQFRSMKTVSLFVGSAYPMCRIQ